MVAERGGTPQLSPREREVLDHIANGLTHSQAARRLNISPGTVDTYLKRIRRKFGPANKADLTRLAMQLGGRADAGALGRAGSGPAMD
jgi:DNA-binding CsgD family transcriptional regulator